MGDINNSQTIRLSNYSTSKPIRDGFGAALVKLGDTHPRVVALTADLGESVRMHHFAETYPERFFEIGISEQNMAVVAAGLALEGMIPFAGTFASFQPYRNLDQIRTSICIMNANVKLVSSHAGFSYPADGVQIQALEDIAIMRTLPNMAVVVPADAKQAEALTLQIAEHVGPVYLRIGRAEAPELSGPDVTLGKAQLLRQGSDLTIIACGYMVHQALQVAEALTQQGKQARVLNMHTIKPIDRDAVLAAAHETKSIVTVEEHQVAGGLGAAVAECLAEGGATAKLQIIGVRDVFGDTAQSVDQLWIRYGLDSESILQQILSA